MRFVKKACDEEPLQQCAFYSMSVVLCIARACTLRPPVVKTITDTTVTLSIRRPSHIIASKVLIYAIQYYMAGSSSWKSTTESTSLLRTITGLHTDSMYWFRVVAKYRGQHQSLQSRAIQARTKTRKCILYCC